MGQQRDQGKPSQPPLPPEAMAETDFDASTAGRATERGGPPAVPPDNVRPTIREAPPLPPGPGAPPVPPPEAAVSTNRPEAALPPLPSTRPPEAAVPTLPSMPPPEAAVSTVPSMPSPEVAVPSPPPSSLPFGSAVPSMPPGSPVQPVPSFGGGSHAEPPPFPGPSAIRPSGRVTGSLLVPLLTLGVAIALTVLAGALRAVSFNIGFGLGQLQLYLAWTGWPMAFLLGLAAGIAAISSPISARASGGLTVVGIAVAVLGLLASLSFMTGPGLGELPRSLAQVLVSGRTAAIVMGVVAVLVARRARSAGSSPKPVVIALLVAAVLVGFEGSVQVLLLVGPRNLLDVLDQLALALASFSLAAGLLLLVAAVLLVLHGARSGLRVAVMAAAAVTAGFGLLAQLATAVFDINSFVGGAVGGAVPGVALAAFAIAALAGRWPTPHTAIPASTSIPSPPPSAPL